MDLQSLRFCSFFQAMKKATQQQTKEHNRSLVLKTIFDHKSISRAEIARQTGLTRTTVSDLVTELMAAGLVEESGIGESLGGKSPILLSVIENSRYLIGLDLAHDKFYGAIVNLRGKICASADLPIFDCGREKALSAVYEILDKLVQAPYHRLVGIGVGTPGLVNTLEGTVVNAVNLEWQDIPLASLLQNRYHLPVTILNDSQAAAMGEYMYGAGSQLSGENLVVINVGNGIGSGVIIRGQLFQGDGGGAGEIGHVAMVLDGGQLCRCGNRGCLETLSSARAVVQQARLLAAKAPESLLAEHAYDLTIDSLEQAFYAGDPLARKVVLEAGYYIGVAIAGLVGTLNIYKVILVGEMARFGQPWLDVIRETLSTRTLSRLAQDTRVEIGHLGAHGVVLGASALLLKDYSLLFEQSPSAVGLSAAPPWLVSPLGR
jgi:glucokinase-like ROK family protein